MDEKELGKLLARYERMAKKNKARPEMVSRQKVPKYFDGLHPKTLANLESKGMGPKSFKRGRLRFYMFEDLVNFIKNNQ